MPRYLIITQRCTPELLWNATTMLTSRFPEVSLDSRHTDANGELLLVCTAPSEEHARRWLSSADISFEAIDQHSSNDG